MSSVTLHTKAKVVFAFRGTEYRIKIVGAEIYPQGFAAVAEKLGDFKGVNMLCDIGNGTMNLLRIVNKKPDAQKMFTEKYGTHQCALLIREQMMKVHHAALDDTIVTEILKKGTADIDEQYLDTVIKTAKEYTAGIFRRLREHEYDSKLMKLYVVGGGGCLIRNFADYDASRVIINDDICATAKGYEYICAERNKSVIQGNKFFSNKMEYWIKKSGGMTHRDILRKDIDSIIKNSTRGVVLKKI